GRRLGGRAFDATRRDARRPTRDLLPPRSAARSRDSRDLHSSETRVRIREVTRAAMRSGPYLTLPLGGWLRSCTTRSYSRRAQPCSGAASPPAPQLGAGQRASAALAGGSSPVRARISV